MTKSKEQIVYTNLDYLNISAQKVLFNPSAEALIQESISQGEGTITDLGALSIKTGRFTGRSPKDRYVVSDEFTNDTVDWNNINQKISKSTYNSLKEKIQEYLSDSAKVYVKDGIACAHEDYELNVRLVAEKPWSAQFVHNMFRRPDSAKLATMIPDWHILCAPGCYADPVIHDTTAKNFSIINFTEKTILIGGSGYTGEIKKGIFSVLNYLLPQVENVLSMHCSANIGQDEDTAIFFGLSGTGKTTLSTDPNRALIGDDEHGWANDGVFNFEGGCYAKCIDLSPEKEPEIYKAIRPGAILENIGFHEGTQNPDFSSTEITQNTRVSYPIYHIDNAQPESRGGNPKNVFFLTCDAFGVLPPVSRLTKAQAMYHFISGYTAKVAGTEDGISEPQATFSACFGAPFLPLHPTKYATMLGDKLDTHESKCWLINTGWTSGAFPVGHRINLKYTRAIITAILTNQLDDVDYKTTDIFGLSIPSVCPGVPSDILDPVNTWSDRSAYEKQAAHLANLFTANFQKYSNEASKEIIAAAPKLESILTY